MKFAIIKTGGKQYITKVGDTLKIEKIIGDFKVGSKIMLDNVLATFTDNVVDLGKPMLGSKVEAEIIAIDRHDKVTVLRYMPKSRWAKKNGHKQPYFEVKILAI